MEFKKYILNKSRSSIKDEINETFQTPIDILFSSLINEGVNDKAIFKAVFLAGGPGSGKDYVLDNTLAGHGLTEINSDKALEYLMDRDGLDKRMPKSEEEARNLIRGKAKNTTELRQRLALQGRNGIIVNGTGDDPEKIKKIKDRLEELGYESQMIMVNTRDEVSQQRNIERGQRGGRTVPEEIRKEKWDSVQAARPDLAKLFGSNYKEFDNSEDLRQAAPEIVDAKQKEMLDIFKNIKQFVDKPPEHEKAQGWIAQELGRKDLLKVKKSDTGKVPHDYQSQESGPASQAKQMGLQYLGYGRYGKNHHVTHRVVNGKLVEIPKEPVSNGKAVPVQGSITTNRKTPATSLISTKAKVPSKEKNVLSKIKTAETGIKKEDIESAFSDLMLTENYEFSDKGAFNILTLGTKMVEHEYSNPDSILDENVTLTQAQVDKMNALKDSQGKVKIFVMRRTATQIANQKNGTVYKGPRGYVIKLKENYNEIIRESTELVQENTLLTECSDTGSCDCACSGSNTKKTLAQTKKALREKSTTESIDKGIESGLSMASGGENLMRGSLRTKSIKPPLEELTGDETTASISAQKEDELKKAGISLRTFKTKGYL